MKKQQEYNEFIKKFERKLTTDDCYTPPQIYEVVKQWCVKRYKLNNLNILRPFYPGGDYKNVKYTENDVVIDNPPFSILAEIVDFYLQNNIKFFIFCDSRTMFSINRQTLNYVIGSTIIYENGARVNTSFLTNLSDCKIEINSDLCKLISTPQQKGLVKNAYPNNLLTFSRCQQIARKGVNVKIGKMEIAHTRKVGSTVIFGGGFFVNSRVEEIIKDNCVQYANVIAETDKQKEIIKGLNKND